MSRRKPPRVPSCPRCGNEEDLWQWLNGETYCVSCIACPHGVGGTTYVCPTCVRRLHSIITFEGPRIVNVHYYVAEAWREYGLPPSELLTWTFAEQGVLNEMYDEHSVTRSFGITAPPPHHRFTSSGGSR